MDLQLPALIVIDLQKYFLSNDGDAFLSDAPKIVPNIHKLIEKFREKKLPIVYTRHAHKKNEETGQMGKWWGNQLPWEGDSQSEIISDINPRSDELVIIKKHYSAFFDTELEKYLKNKKIKEIVLCGVLTNCCIETTARDGFMRNFQPVVIEDACATKSKNYHEASILNLSYAFSHISKTTEFIKSL